MTGGCRTFSRLNIFGTFDMPCLAHNPSSLFDDKNEINAAEVYLSRHGQLCSIGVSLVRFFFAKTLTMQNYSEKYVLKQKQSKLMGIAQPMFAKVCKF